MRNNSHCPGVIRGFTLVELLVVIAIPEILVPDAVACGSGRVECSEAKHMYEQYPADRSGNSEYGQRGRQGLLRWLRFWKKCGLFHLSVLTIHIM